MTMATTRLTLTLLTVGSTLLLPSCDGWGIGSSRHLTRLSKTRLFSTFDDDQQDGSSRRGFITAVAVNTAALLSASSVSADSSNKILVLGGTGLVGSEVCRQLKDMGIDVVATSRNGRAGTVALDVTAPNVNVAAEVEKIAKGCTAVISTIGMIGSSSTVGAVNAASGLAAAGAKAAGVGHFTFISVAPEVREFAKEIDFFKDYMVGKTFSEESIVSSFGRDAYTLIEPTFIYGGNEFGVNPPRVASFYGKAIEGLLSSGPLRAIASVAPEGIVKVALEPPVSAEAVASACVASALGRQMPSVLDTYDKIQAAAKML